MRERGLKICPSPSPRGGRIRRQNSTTTSHPFTTEPFESIEVIPRLKLTNKKGRHGAQVNFVNNTAKGTLFNTKFIYRKRTKIFKNRMDCASAISL